MRFAQAFSLRANVRRLLFAPNSNLRPLDGIRALSLLWVVAYHTVFFLYYFVPRETFDNICTPSLLRWTFCNGELGTDAFFALSGFLISDLLMRERQTSGRISLPRFYTRRAMRLLPTYYVILALFAIIGPMRPTFDCQTLWANLLYVNNLVPIARQCMAWCWSLGLEEQFYILFPVFLIGCYRFRLLHAGTWIMLIGISALITAVVTLRHVPDGHFVHRPLLNPWFPEILDAIHDKPYTRFGALACGVLGAYLVRYRGLVLRLEHAPIRATALAVFAVFAFAGVLWAEGLGSSEAPWQLISGTAFLATKRLAIAGAIACWVIVSLTKTPAGRTIGGILGCAFWHPIAQLSYCAYLVHPIAVWLIYSTRRTKIATHPTALVGYYCLSVLLSLLAAAAIHLFIERPIMNLRPRRSTHAGQPGLQVVAEG